MDARGGKLLEFLKENNHLDLEVPDIAFSIKKSEKTVEAALQKLQQRGLVTARQNEYGRIYWYALPSAPITRTFKLEELSTLKEEALKMSNEMDDEVDLSELQASNVKASSKYKKVPDIQPEAGSSKKNTPPKGSRADIVSASEKVVTQSAPAPLSPAKELPEFKSVAAEIKDDEDSARRKFNVSVVTLPSILIVGIISIGALVRSCSVDSQISAVQSAIPKNFATAEDVKAIKKDLEKIAVLQSKIERLTTSVDSLNGVIMQMQVAGKSVTAAPVRATTSPTKQQPSRKRR